MNYLPFPPGTGDGNFRPEAARWPGGGVDSYMERVRGGSGGGQFGRFRILLYDTIGNTWPQSI
eukprot:1185890-Prorocentrum_minimum.AAC.3